MFINESEANPQRERSITFEPSDFEGVVPYNDDPMVVTLQIFNWDVKRVLIDPRSSTDILYYDAFEKIGLDPEQLHPFKGTLAGFTGEQVHVCGHITLKIIFRTGVNAKTIRVKYLVVSAPNCYNIIIGQPSFNLLGAFLSTRFLVMKYPMEKGKVGTLRGDQKTTRECYHNSLKLRKGKKKVRAKEKPLSVNMIDPREEHQQGTSNPPKS